MLQYSTHPRFVIGIAVGVLSLLMRLPGLGEILTVDEPQWIFRSQSFYGALERGDPGGTFQGTHPGVVPMLLIGGGIRLKELATGTTMESPTVGSFRTAAKLPVAGAVSVAIGAAAALTASLWGTRTGIATGALLALDPLLVGHSQLAHVDALLAVLMLLSVLTLLLSVRAGTRRTLALSGFLGGLALLTKLPAVFLLPLVAGTILLWKRSLRPAARDIALWVMIAAATFVVLWPSMWKYAAPNARYAARDVRTITTVPHVGEAAEVTARGSSFYLRALVTRTTPIALLLAIGGSILLLRAELPDRRREGYVLLASVLGFLLFLTLVEKKADRYLLPALLGVDLLAGIALAQLLARRKLGAVMFGVAISGLILLNFALSPYALAYRNPLFGSEEPTQSGWGEGLEQAARILNTHPLAAELHVASWYPAVFSEFFLGKTMSLSSRHDPRVAYVVLYRNMRGRAPDSAAADILKEFAERTPVAVVKILGIEMAWIYATDSVRLFPQHVGEIISGVEVGQFIYPTQGELSGIRLVFATFSSRENTAEVIVHLREDPDGADLRTVRLEAGTLRDNQWQDISFPPIPDSNGKRYYLAVTSPAGRPGNAVTVRYQPKDILQGSPVFLRSPLNQGQRREDMIREGDIAYGLLYEGAR